MQRMNKLADAKSPQNPGQVGPGLWGCHVSDLRAREHVIAVCLGG